MGRFRSSAAESLVFVPCFLLVIAIIIRPGLHVGTRAVRASAWTSRPAVPQQTKDNSELYVVERMPGEIGHESAQLTPVELPSKQSEL